MLELCVKKDRKGMIILSLNGKTALKDDERILGYAKAVMSDKDSYLCKDKASILSPGDIVYMDDINENGGWVEIVDFTHEEAEGSTASGTEAEAIRLYNRGVELFDKGSCEEAMDAFRQCYEFPRVIYAECLAQRRGQDNSPDGPRHESGSYKRGQVYHFRSSGRRLIAAVHHAG